MTDLFGLNNSSYHSENNNYFTRRGLNSKIKKSQVFCAYTVLYCSHFKVNGKFKCKFLSWYKLLFVTKCMEIIKLETNFENILPFSGGELVRKV